MGQELKGEKDFLKCKLDRVTPWLEPPSGFLGNANRAQLLPVAYARSPASSLPAQGF